MAIVPQSGSYAQLPLFPEQSEPKVCTRCKKPYPRTEEFWNKDRSRRDGFCNKCKPCHRAEARRYVENNVSTVQIRQHQWYEDNKEKTLDRVRTWAENNPGKTRRYKQRWLNKNSQKHTDSVKRWQQSNPEKLRAAAKHRRARKKGALGSHTTLEILELLDWQGGVCMYCGSDISNCYTEDHYLPLDSDIKDDSIHNIVLACKSCNSSKNNKLPWLWDNRLF